MTEREARPLLRPLREAVPQLIALFFGLVAGGVLILAAGYDPILVYSSLVRGALGSQVGQSETLSFMGTFLLSGLAFLIPGKAGIWNVGAQGQIYLGGSVAALVAVFVPLPPLIWPFVALVAGVLAGSAWAAIPGLLEAYRNASAIVTTIMMNYIGNSLATFLLFYAIALGEPKLIQNNNTAYFKHSVLLPQMPYFTTSVMVVVAILVALAFAYFFRRTTLGYNIRAAGTGPGSAQAKGINTKRMKVIAMVIGGAVAGLAGVGDVIGAGHACGAQACLQVNFASGWFGGEGFAGIAVALVAASSPIGAVFSALFFSVLVAGAPLASAGGPQLYMIWALQGIIIIFMAMPHLSNLVLKRARKLRRPRAEAP